MAKQCDGVQLVEMLLEELECENKNQLANKLNVSAPKIQSWESAKTLSKTVIKNVIDAVRSQAVKSAIDPIVEFHKLNHYHGNQIDNLRKKIDDPEICERLKNSRGIYSFYDSNGKIVYVGKTEKNNLLSEMEQAFKLKRPNYQRKLANKDGKFSVHRLGINDTAEFLSAYEVHQSVIGNVEAFLTRMVPNDVVNKKTESFR
jgi:phage-related protein